MRKLKLQVQLSVDGFIAGPNGEMDWMVWDWDEALNKSVAAITDPVDTKVLGRKLAEGFIPTWSSRLENPETADDGARKFVESPASLRTRARRLRKNFRQQNTIQKEQHDGTRCIFS